MTRCDTRIWRILGWTIIGLWLFFSMSLALHDRAGSLAMRGSSELLRSDYSAATVSFRQATRLPGFASLHRYGYAVALCQNGAVNDALRQLRSAPQDDKTTNAIGICLLLKDDPANGIPQFREAIAKRGDCAVYHHNLSVALARVGDGGAAESERHTAQRLSKDASAGWTGLYFAPPWGMAKTEVIKVAQPLPRR